ncbi:hypothetical protein [Sphingobacterium suaedae]|uniref:DUF4859 domain-containing protein n=1 Tax=Sphingobacterium suaedae TaxID=1686402 RepID=A0ABW5KJ71_9SPHI
MKKILLACLIGTATLAVGTSCTKEYYDVIPSITMVYQRADNQWTYNSNTKVWYLDLPVNELTDYYVDQGIVNVAMSFDGETTYNAIPATFGAIAYSYDYTTGSVRIYAEDPIADTGVEITPPENIFIKISLTEADFVE